MTPVGVIFLSSERESPSDGAFGQHTDGVLQEHFHRRGRLRTGVERRAQRNAGGRVNGDHRHVADALFGDQLVHYADAETLLHHGHDGKALDGGVVDVGLYVAAGKECLHVVVTAQSRHDEAVVLAVLERVAVRLRQRVIPGQQRHHGILRQRDPLEGHILLIAEKADVGGAFLQPLGDLLPDALHELDLHVGVVLLEGADDGGEPVGGDAGIGGDGDGADEEPLHLGGQLEELVLLMEYLPDNGQQQLSVGGECHALGAAAEERKADLLLQRGDQLVDAGGGVAQDIGGAGKAACFGSRQKGAAAGCLHNVPPLEAVSITYNHCNKVQLYFSCEIFYYSINRNARA